ncbi:hypothetical protein D9756_002433 [Leucocoprinus leucothites]|uniref:Uncharacterized protein n=1 Tax=Leucocoprinus leucothites TaxID=201217 RepID=A0A8H5LM81_9AGAR|nr:hypothetical protein D9756_002433 [Leucoagaricus leucothites]
MEDPWVNAWGDPQKSSSEIPAKPPLTSAWSSSSNVVTDDQADIAVPSWEPESGAIWDDSPDLHLWSRDNRTSDLWSVPTFDSIGFAKPSQESLSLHQPDTPPRSSSPPQPEHTDQEIEHNEDIPTHDTHNIDSIPLSLTSNPETVPQDVSQQSIPEPSDILQDRDGKGSEDNSLDADGFGTFEDAVESHSQSGSWVPHQTLSEIEGAGDWGETWKYPEAAVDDSDTEPLDEWELAKRQKEMQDRYVPPELLSSILSRFDEFASDYWPEEPSGDTAYQHSRDDLADMLGISSIVDRFIPSDLSLPLSTPVMKTFISKEMIEAVKLTRHHIVTRNSPLSVYMNTKGSLSWEASVKSKPDAAEADVVPSGWRIVPKENSEQHQSANDAKKKASGGLLSFFGRKSNPSAPPSGSTSPIRASTPVGTSPRASITSSRPSVDVNADPSAVAKPVASTSGKADTVSSATMAALAEVSSTGKADTSSPVPQTEEPVQAPSAVSRFLGRFSRSNKPSTANSRNSIALSTDDLEFLSDIVPSAHDELDDINQLNALSTTIRAPPVPTKLPPPLAPPPRAPPLPKPLSPPPFISSQPINPAGQTSFSSNRLNTAAGSIESQLFDLVPDFSSQPQPRPPLQTASASVLAPPIQISGPSAPPPPLPPPLSPITPRSRTPVNQSPLAMSTAKSFDSLFDDDDFSDFQTSPNTTLTPMMSLDSAFDSFTTPQTPVRSQQSHDEPTSLDDFDDFVSPPPQVPDKSNLIPLQRSIPPPKQSIPSIPRINSTPPAKQSGSLHQRRVSKQADSDLRTLSLLEAAAARGKWPAPPSPLPNAIPAPMSKSAENNLFDAFSEDASAPSASVAVPNTTLSLSSPSNSISPPMLAAAPPPTELAISGNAAGLNSSGSRPALSGMRSPPLSALAMTPPPLIPPHSPMKPVTPAPLFQAQNGQNSQSQVQWKIPSPPSASPSPSFPQPNVSLGFSPDGSSGANGSRSATPLQQHLQQQKPALSPPAVLHTRSGSTSSQNPGSGGGKLSAQDLSFFEGL